MGFFGGGGASVDLASPPAIGNTTPNTGAFTTLSFAPDNNTTGFSNTSNSLTGSNAQSLINFAQTWNTTGTPTGLKFNITDTASNSASLIFDFQIGGTSRLSLRKDGRLSGAGTYSVLRSSGFEAHDGASILYFVNPFSGNVGIYTSASIQWGSSAAPSNNQGDIKIIRDTTGVLALQNGVNSQSLRLYNTFTDASNYERGFMRWATNVLEIGAEAAGTGTQRTLSFLGGSNNAAISFTANSLCAIFGNNANTFYKIIQLEAGLRYTGNDAGLFRNAAGVVEVNNGTAGTFRDLIVRNFRMSAPTGVPTANNSTGTEGSIRWDADYIYICTATNTWKRVAIATG